MPSRLKLHWKPDIVSNYLVILDSNIRNRLYIIYLNVFNAELAAVTIAGHSLIPIYRRAINIGCASHGMQAIGSGLSQYKQMPSLSFHSSTHGHL